jgi:hypothetical protein
MRKWREASANGDWRRMSVLNHCRNVIWNACIEKKKINIKKEWQPSKIIIKISVADPDPNPNPPDPHVFGPPGYGSIRQRYRSGSWSFYHHAKIVRKSEKPWFLLFCDFLTIFLWKMM